MVPVFQMLGKCVWLKTTALFSLLSVVSKVSEKLVMWHLFYFQYGIRYSRSTADLLTVASDRIPTVEQ